MKMRNEMKTTTEERMKDVASRLPELGIEQLERARKNTSWANRFRHDNIGYIHDDKTCGVTWQVVRNGRVRCIRVWDDEWCYESLAMMIVTFEMADIEVEVDPHVLVTPVVPTTPSPMMQPEPLESEVLQ
jgi:hypothetical protein